MQYIIPYLIFMNVIAFSLMGIDKKKAKKKEWRVPENTLLSVAAFGGSFGGFLGMKVFHHKTLHPKFKYGIPFFLLIHTALLAWMISRHF